MFEKQTSQCGRIVLTSRREWFETKSTPQEGNAVYEAVYDRTKMLRSILVNYEDAAKF